jgi:hypothetical protein
MEKEMKKLWTATFAVMTVLFCGCSDIIRETVSYQVNEPVFMSAEAFRESVKVSPRSQSIADCGKICFYEGYLYISEQRKGIHIIDNRNPARPENIGFIELPGNADIAIRNGMLYADMHCDLVWFNIDNPAKPQLVDRLEGAFPGVLPPTDNEYGIDYAACYNTDGSPKGIIVGWNVRTKTETVEYYRNRGEQVVNDAMSFDKSNSSTGVNGSMSRFVLYRNYLYAVINNFMMIIDLAGDRPEKVANMFVGNVETIFNYKDYLFMGMPTGMAIYSVADPLNPEHKRTVWHVYGCDPVVVENDRAYVTIHSGNACGQTNNDLIIYDVSDVSDPKHIVTYAMTNPKGLGIDNGTLFLCDDGLKIFDASDPQTLLANRLAHYSGMDGFDVIPFNHVLMMIADDGLYQYDYTDVRQIKQLSKLPIEKHQSPD